MNACTMLLAIHLLFPCIKCSVWLFASCIVQTFIINRSGAIPDEATSNSPPLHTNACRANNTQIGAFVSSSGELLIVVRFVGETLRATDLQYKQLTF